MPDFKYRASLRDGKIIRGKIVAVNKSQAISKLKFSKIQPITVKRLKEVKRRKFKSMDLNKKDLFNSLNVKPKFDMKKLNFSEWNPLRRVSTKDIIMFVNNLYILKKAKFNNIQALESIYEGTENPVFKDIVEDILIGVQEGERLNVVMANYPNIFPPMFINFIKVGEESGSLDTALLHARDYVESSTKLRKQVRAAVIPRVLQFVGIIAAMIAALLIGVPLLKDVYSMFGSSQQIPKATLVAVNIAEWIVSNWVIVLGITVLIVLGFFVYINTPRGRYLWDKFVLTAPVVGALTTNITVSKFFQAMLLNLRNGMRIQESLEVSKNVTGNYYFLSVVEVGKSNSLAGDSWIEPFEEHHIFKPMVTEMLQIGMKTDLSEMMEKINEYIRMEIEESMNRFVKWLPEVTYLFVGIALIAFMITVMVPLINVYMGGFIEIPK